MGRSTFYVAIGGSMTTFIPHLTLDAAMAHAESISGPREVQEMRHEIIVHEAWPAARRQSVAREPK